MSDWKFQREEVAAFRFVRCGLDAESGVAQLVYAFDEGPELIETVTIPGAPFTLEGKRAMAVEQALRLLHLIAGVSYYKAAVPPEIRIEGYSIDAETAALLETIYVSGLGEFAYRNGLNLHGQIRFPDAQKPAPSRGELGGDGVWYTAQMTHAHAHHPPPSLPLGGGGARSY